jgi:hypothetical protein
MEIVRNEEKNIKVYALGIETEYRGVSTVYDDEAKTFVYYYYPQYKRMYVLDGKTASLSIPLVNNKIRVITVLEDQRVVKFNHYFKKVIENKRLFYFPDSFFREIRITMYKKKWLPSDVLSVFLQYGGEICDFNQ